MNFSKSKNRHHSIRIIDVKKALSLAIVFAFLSVGSLNAQSTPEPPTPPKITKSSGTSYSISIDDDDDETSNSSVSISISDATYKFRASFHKSKNDGVKAMLLKTLGKSNLKINGNTYVWSDSKSGDELFECKLTKGHLRMYLDTEVTSKGFLDKINALGNDLKYYISGTDPKKEAAKKAERAQRDLERAQKDLERAKANVSRLKKN